MAEKKQTAVKKNEELENEELKDEERKNEETGEETLKELSLEEAFARLDQITRSLEDEEITLEDSFQAYKKGMDLLKLCNDTIDRVEKKVMVLNGEGGLDEF